MTGYHPSTLSVAKRIQDTAAGIDDGPHGRIDFMDGEKPHTLDASTAMDLAESIISLEDAVEELLADWRSDSPFAQHSLIYQRAQSALDEVRTPHPTFAKQEATS